LFHGLDNDTKKRGGSLGWALADNFDDVSELDIKVLDGWVFDGDSGHLFFGDVIAGKKFVGVFFSQDGVFGHEDVFGYGNVFHRVFH